VVYIRGTNWNATSISYTKKYENVNIQAINRVSRSPVGTGADGRFFSLYVTDTSSADDSLIR
jgi:hypothetical protein